GRLLRACVGLSVVWQPVFDSGRAEAAWTLVGDDRHTADATGAGLTIRLRTDLAMGLEGNRVSARHVLENSDKAFCALSWAEQLAPPADGDDATARLAATTSFWRNWPRQGPPPRPPRPRRPPRPT